MTALALRPINIRLRVAQIADAYYKFDPTVKPGNTLTRAISLLDENGSQYNAIWQRIGSFYERQGWSDLADAELNEVVTVAFRLGYTEKVSATRIHVEEITKSVKKWRDTLWFRYEMHRDSRRKIVYKYAPLGVSVAILCVTGQWINSSNV